MPPTLRNMVLERLHQASPTARRVLEAAAVLAEPATEATLRDVAGLTDDEVRAGAAAAVASALLAEDERGRLRFRHALMGRAVYEAMPAAERQRRHRSAGTTLVATKPLPLVQLARHFREAGDAVTWAGYAEQAARQAVAADDFTAAVLALADVVLAPELPAGFRTRLGRMLGAAALKQRDSIDDLHHRVARTLQQALASGRATATAAAAGNSP